MVETRRSRRRDDEVEFQELPMTPSPRRRRKGGAHPRPDDHSDGGNESDVTPIKFGGGSRKLKLEEELPTPSSLKAIEEDDDEEMPDIQDAPPDGDDKQEEKSKQEESSTVETRSNQNSVQKSRTQKPKRGRSKSPLRSRSPTRSTEKSKAVHTEPVETTKSTSKRGRSKSPVPETKVEKESADETNKSTRKGRSKSPVPVTEKADKDQKDKDKEPAEKEGTPRRGRSRSPVPKSTNKKKEKSDLADEVNEVAEENSNELIQEESAPKRGRSSSPVPKSANKKNDQPESESTSKRGRSRSPVPSTKKAKTSATEESKSSTSPEKSTSTESELTELKKKSADNAPREKEKLVVKIPPRKSPKKKSKSTKNELTSIVPGYTARLQLDSSSLDKQKSDLESLRKRALVTDKTTAAFVKGSVANQKQTREILTVKPGSLVSNAFKTGNKPEPVNHAGDKWFGMVPTPLTEEVKRDLHVIRNRGYLDPKRFYKSSDKESKFVQIGTVIEGSAEYYSARLTKKERRSNFTDEVMADTSTADYAKRKYRSMQQEKNAKVQQRQPKKKKARRMHA